MKSYTSSNRFFRIALFCLLLLPGFLLSAQTDDKDYQLKDHLWYGINVGGLGIGSNSFSVGLAPMGGYRFNDYFSIGLIAKANYTYLWQRLGDNFSNLDYGAGALGRVKFFKGKYFAQLEYDIMSITLFNGIQESRDTLPFFYLGGGVHYPGKENWSSELSILINVHPDSSQEIFPLTMNYAFVYNF